MPSSTRTLHIVSGDAAAGPVQAAAGCDRNALLIHHDILSVGPLGPLQDPKRWNDTRFEVWRADAGDKRFGDFSRDLVDEAEELVTADQIILWLGSALSDQLLLAFTVELCDRIGADARKLALVQEPIVGIGMLAPDEVPSPAEADPLDAAELDFARKAWAAVIAPEPEPLLDLLAEAERAGAAAPLPYLRAALGARNERFPAPKSGLSLWDESLLAAAVRDGPSVSAIIRRALTERRLCNDPVGDTALLQRLRRLADARLAEPLFLMPPVVPGEGSGQPEARLLPAGLAVAHGQASFLALNSGAADLSPLDDWVGGVLVSPARDRLWMRRIAPDGRGWLLVRAPRKG